MSSLHTRKMFSSGRSSRLTKLFESPSSEKKKSNLGWSGGPFSDIFFLRQNGFSGYFDFLTRPEQEQNSSALLSSSSLLSDDDDDGKNSEFESSSEESEAELDEPVNVLNFEFLNENRASPKGK